MRAYAGICAGRCGGRVHVLCGGCGESGWCHACWLAHTVHTDGRQVCSRRPPSPPSRAELRARLYLLPRAEPDGEPQTSG